MSLRISIAGSKGRMARALREYIWATDGLLSVTLENAEVLIDFTAPAATPVNVRQAADRGIPAVIGTTGLTKDQASGVFDLAKTIPIVWSANMSVGVNVLLAAVERASAQLGPAYGVGIFEMHHSHKVDAPSGTALALGRATGREPVSYASLRLGEEVGVHTVNFAAPGERLELTHRSFSREAYAAGAVRAAQWLIGREPGLYDMRDVLGLREAKEASK